VNTQRIPPVWILSLPFIMTGLLGGFAFVTLPQMLARQGVPGGEIAVAVAICTSPSFWAFLLAPFLDVRFRRRTYVLVFGALAVVATAFTVVYHASLVAVETVMLLSILALNLCQAAMGGWLGSLVEKGQDSRLGAWYTIYAIGGAGIGVLISGWATQKLPPAQAAAIVLVTFLLPLLVCFAIPAPPPSQLLASENFSRFAREILLLLKRREVLVALAMLALPSASFSLTNVLGGWSENFRAPPSLVSIIGGGGIIVGGILGSLMVPLLARKLPLRPLYLSIGLVGAAFTLSLLLAPRVPTTFGFAFLGEYIFQSAAVATALAITFEVIGPDNPLAATTFALLGAAMNFPIDYMDVVDAHGYNWHGITGAFIVDALVSGLTCVLLAIVLRRSFVLVRTDPQIRSSTPSSSSL
jgi:MFS transporter, PAT family, beta-lactamase induction signal transducer AmpG